MALSLTEDKHHEGYLLLLITNAMSNHSTRQSHFPPAVLNKFQSSRMLWSNTISN